ncbi:MAG: V-type ATPase 116kDa subunit family protein [Pseudomonadota bacterium]|nr:V-type ATPase 116kDa subunit family protein [Pseudomonadota bacterium]
MKHVRLLVLTEDLPQASLTLAQTESFHADTRPPEETRLSDIPGRGYRELFQQARSRLDKIGKLIPLPADPELADVHVIPEPELAEVNTWLGKIWNECSRYEEQFRALDDEERLVKEQEASLANFANLNINLAMLGGKTRFLDYYVGIVPRENVRQLEDAAGLADHLVFVYMVSGDHAHVVIVGPTGEQEAQLSSVLNAAGFQYLPIPQELMSEPSKLREELAERREGVDQERGGLHKRLSEWSASFDTRLRDAERVLTLAEPFVTLDPSIRSAGHLAYLAGWVPARSVADLEQRLRDTLASPFEMQARNPLPDERTLVPSVPIRTRLLTPFALLVKQYGIPQYGEFDPTALFAVTFVLMFGMMFGDVGHGAVIAGAAWLLRGKLGRFTPFGYLIGASSIVFGFLFGSVFGYEEILHPLWMSPLSDPILMLKIALGWGVAFIVLACLLTIYNRLAIGNLHGALLAHHGAVNLAFYLALLGGGYNLAVNGSFGWQATVVVIASLLALAANQWQEIDAPTGEKALVVVIETLDIIIAYVSNTLSFLRVAAFSLNHVALSIAVFTLAGMMGTVGHWITVVLGNVFILVLEGGIVIIQVMRLEYYEGFSRYFSGDGHEFAPLRLRKATGEQRASS